MEIDTKIDITIGVLIFGIFMLILAFILEFIDMMIDHQCYQLEPNDRYQSTVCEKYWKVSDK